MHINAYLQPRSAPQRVGDRVIFVPSAFVRVEVPGIARSLAGTVIDVNAEHRHYTVEGECNGHTLRESYKF